MGGIERWASFPRSTMERERERERGKQAYQGRRRGGVFIPPPIEIAVTAFQGPDIPVQVWPGKSAPVPLSHALGSLAKIEQGQIIQPSFGKNRPKIRPPIWVTRKKSLAKTTIT
jgi:hypothetical protein